MKILQIVFVLGFGFCLAQDITQVNSNFIYAENIDVMTDEDTSFIWTCEIESKSSSREGTLIWSCQYDGLNLALNTNEFLNSDGEPAYIRYRFDSNEVEDWQVWDVNPSNIVAVAPLEFVGPINSRFANAEKIAVQAGNYESEVYTFIFNITGFSEALSKLSCANN